MRTAWLRYLAFGVLLAAAGACGGQDGAAVAERPVERAPSSFDAALGFSTGPAVLVPPGYDPPDDRVDSTGAYLPVNGKPTLVYLEAIW